ncbi:MAG: peptide chain release factor N(5)-glutamine methyltransferase [Clostridiales bacterium]|nr:peptide chain release factor N(5)-glutamine methyltransferase [Clostridiales bacterium]
MSTLFEALRRGRRYLAEEGLEEAGQDAWLLLEYVTGFDRAIFFMREKEELAPEKEARYRELLARRASHVPVQQLTGRAWFMGYEFYVNEDVLIPRLDTEVLAEEGRKVLMDVRAPRILDMCTGSGCLLITLLVEFPEATGVGADISRRALAVAKRNAVSLGVEKRAEFVESDAFSAPFFSGKGGKFVPEYDILISNPPYIPTGDLEDLCEEVRLHDPRLALDGGADGLTFYRRITGAAGEFLKPGGWLLYEIGYDQSAAVEEILRESGYKGIRTVQDLAGKDRVVLGQKEE